jgi:hypothetical protein
MDYENADSATGSVMADLNGAGAMLDAATAIVVAFKSGAIVIPTANGHLILNPAVSLDDMEAFGHGSIIQLPDIVQMLAPVGVSVIKNDFSCESKIPNADGSDIVMHSMLDIPVFASLMADNDNAAITPGAGDASKNVTFDMMINRLLAALRD